MGSAGGATKPYCGLPTTAEYGGGRSFAPGGAPTGALGTKLFEVAIAMLIQITLTIRQSHVELVIKFINMSKFGEISYQLGKI